MNHWFKGQSQKYVTPVQWQTRWVNLRCGLKKNWNHGLPTDKPKKIILTNLTCSVCMNISMHINQIEIVLSPDHCHTQPDVTINFQYLPLIKEPPFTLQFLRNHLYTFNSVCDYKAIPNFSDDDPGNNCLILRQICKLF